jgi:hypothetical protein
MTPEGRFSRRTTIAAVEVVERATKTHADLTRYLLKCSSELAAWCNDGALADRFNHLIKFFDSHPGYRLDDNRLLEDELVETAVSMLPSEETPPWREPSAPPPEVTALLSGLNVDGFIVVDGVLRRAFPATLNLLEAEDEITRLLAKHTFAVAKGHLDQALLPTLPAFGRLPIPQFS